MTIARPAGSGGGVTAAEVNLKFVWEVVSRIKIGEAGPAYVVDSTGTLIAHPDISLVLKKTDLQSAAAGRALRAPMARRSRSARDIKGDEVFSAHAAIPTLRWTVFVESPRAEALAPLYASLVRAALLLGAGLLSRPPRASSSRARWCGRCRRCRKARRASAPASSTAASRSAPATSSKAWPSSSTRWAPLKASYADLERKVEQRTARADRGARLPDRDQRGAARDQRVADRRGAGVRGDPRAARRACSAARWRR